MKVGTACRGGGSIVDISTTSMVSFVAVSKSKGASPCGTLEGCWVASVPTRLCLRLSPPPPYAIDPTYPIDN
ncbi:unnamed protein product [Lasius platythorax]|uniref:Uncharacterized protein n=1 Tax=Lasius platythorax TaxID=488582 RepID=A0AAV2N3Q8_9HYME